jgi:hypothetical protein
MIGSGEVAKIWESANHVTISANRRSGTHHERNNVRTASVDILGG